MKIQHKHLRSQKVSTFLGVFDLDDSGQMEVDADTGKQIVERYPASYSAVGGVGKPLPVEVAPPQPVAAPVVEEEKSEVVEIDDEDVTPKLGAVPLQLVPQKKNGKSQKKRNRE